MPVRQINSPGVEIREINASQTAPSIVGTACLVMGFANKGEAYEPVDIVSVADLETNFGTPRNAAERYFYYACREIIQENGNLVAAKLPYQNDMDSNYKYVSLDVDLAGAVTDLSAVQADLSEISTALNDLSGSTNVSQYMKLTLSSAKDITTTAYDTLAAGGTYTTETDEFVIVNELKNRKTGSDEEEGVFVAVIDPIHGMLVQRTIAGTDSDSVDLIRSGELSGSTFNANLSAAYNGSSLSEDMASYFPTVEFTDNGTDISQEYLNWVTVVVAKTIVNANTNGNLDVSILEAWSGSLRSDALDTSNGRSVYIGDVINGSSEYIKFFKTNSDNHPLTAITAGTCLYSQPQSISLLSFTSTEAAAYVNGDLITQDMDTVLEKVSNIDDRQIDIVLDAGLSTIAQFRSVTSGEFDPIEDGAGEISSTTDTSTWRAVATTIDTFCKNVRKDCMGIIDMPRNLVLDGDLKYIRKTAPSNTFGNKIGPKLKYCTGLNSSYLALYSNWTRTADSFSGNNVWLPPSVEAAGIYCRTDRTANFWDAPAGLNRGVMTGVNDLSFNPRRKEADQLYGKSFNYAVQYPQDGFVLEGQKTSSAKPSAFDRVNVRRLFLRLERYVYQVSRYFVYEPNNVFTRRRLVATIEPLFQSVKAAGGLYDFRIVCDETNNTAAVIDSNELKVAILLKPVRTAEYILVDFIATRTDANFDEYL